MTMTMLSQTEAQRELCELNALHLEQALLQARIDAALKRLLDTDAETMRVYSFDGQARDLLPGSRMHVLHEEWKDGRLSPKDSAHDADNCPGHWCHADGRPRSFREDPVISFAFRGTWILAGWDDREAVLVREEVAA